MHGRVVVVASIPAMRRGWAASLRAARFAVEECDLLSEWSGADGVILLITDSAHDLECLARQHGGVGPLVALLRSPSPEEQLVALRLGVTGVGEWVTPVAEVAVMIQAALQGRSTIPSQLGVRLAVSAGETAADLDPLDRTLLRNLAQGTTIHEVAVQVGYSERETFRRLNTLYRRMGVTTRTQAVVQAARWGLVD